MNKQILTLACAAGLVAPMTSYADIKVSGIIQAEAISYEGADGQNGVTINRTTSPATSFAANDRQNFTHDSLGSILNEGPNHIMFDFDEKLGSGLHAEARYTGAFNTSGNFGSSFIGEEAWVGLRASSFHVRYGTLVGAYKASFEMVDPWAWTSLQTRGTGGGMSGDHRMTVDATRTIVTSDSATNGQGLTNEGFVQGALEVGVNFAGFSTTLQGFVDDSSNLDGAGLVEIKYAAPNFAMWLSGAYTQLDDVKNVIATNEDEGKINWKLGGSYQLGPMVTLGLQYEDAEIGAFDENPDGGSYILGSLEVKMNNISVAGWVSGYMSDIDDNARMTDANGNFLDEDALSWAVGGKYHFGKRTMVYAGYRQTDSDNNFRDENVATLGIRHVF
ncbi:porin [Candidatus Marithrix sp. Canyon 246]|uniref:porin n=1 Tax=Candidatus Marithrix sp. Canyon 246 TaxID=1827136 RepID=UPI000849F013|nr:porin [Candidatus Marithrix sp. Canyon 246]